MRTTAAQLRAVPQARRLGEVLVQRGLIGKRDLKRALAHQQEQGGRLGDIVLELKMVDERALATALAEHFGLEFVDLRTVQVDTSVLSFVDPEYARQWTLLPIRLDEDGALVIATADPSDQETLDDLRAVTHVEIKTLMAARSDILRMIDHSYRSFADVDVQAKAFLERLKTQRQEAEAPQPTLQSLSAAAPAVQIVNLLIEQGLRDRASDIHLEPQEDRLRVRYRIDGTLQDVAGLPAEVSASLVSRLKIMANMNIVERHRPQDGQIQVVIGNQQVDIRVATTESIWGEKVVLRLLPKNRELMRLPDLGMTPDVYEEFSRLVRAPFGMIVVSGPTGSGKTTTLYATLSEMDNRERNIMTIEDPVEYVFPDINQIQIREQAGVSFATGLKAILRQDPDVILVGEMRDVETARIGIQSALTGHFVLSSLHATDSVSALMRFLDMGIERFLVAAALSGVVAQRLLRRICSHCAEKYRPSAEEMAFYRQYRRAGTGKKTYVHGAGCNFCNFTGFLGRVGVYELLRLSQPIKRLVVEGASYDDVKKAASAQGLVTLQQRAIEKVEGGVTTMAEVMRTIYEV